MPAASKTSRSKSTTKTTRAASPIRASRAKAKPSGRPGPAPEPGSQDRLAQPRAEAPYVYVYCAVRGAVHPRALTNLPALPDGAPPRVLPLTRGLSLIVGDVPAREYHAEKVEARLSDLDWVGRCGAAHHAVADALVPAHTIAPLRPFTLFSSDERARERFSSLVRELDTALERVSDKAEWVLRIGKPDPALMSAQSKGAGAALPLSGAAFLARKAAAKQAVVQLAARVREDAAAVFDALAKIAEQAERREPEPATGLLLDAAFLVSNRRSTLFKRALRDRAKRLLRSGCRVSLTGPWPPYSFVTLDSGPIRE